jgi:DNA polymerase III subunit epsilon
MDFCALDVETANSARSSICQIGISRFRAGEVVAELSLLIHPRTFFEPFNVGIHGIDQNTVQDAPDLSQAWDEICAFLGDDVVVAHSGFDRRAMRQAGEEYGLTTLDNQWLDCTRVVRRVWTQYRKSGYGLGNLARDFGISFQHHDALSDARTCGVILVKALSESDTQLADWMAAKTTRRRRSGSR